MAEEMGAAAVVRAIIAAREDSDLETGLKYIAPESLDQGRRVGREDWRRKWEHMRAGCPDMEVITEHSVENGEWVANRYTIRGTHTGDFFGQPPTGERFEIKGMDMVRVQDGRLVEHWAIADHL
ncbi:ester cyclase [Actinoallomurus bryophytorum]|uniref:Putative ester cyclase n=1 Tax=Actinoallomurus bryophytorum TaxID=1490222 RepID=A0A543CH71_9ACTN|nr:ester cyclase [Actinoallomurus bryophytorum]TQL96454.1 putative ester cyclase [Actinoallomurus bryophytorum]